MAQLLARFALVACLLLAGCATSQEMQIHLAAANVDRDDANPTVKFYRLTIKGSSTNTKSNLETGFYDAAALRTLYGDVGKEGIAGTTDRSVGSIMLRYDKDNKTWQGLPSNELFTIIYGADADSIAKAVSTYGKSQKVGEALGRLIARSAGDDQSKEAVAAEQTQADTAKDAVALAGATKTASDNLKAAAEGEDAAQRTPATVRAELLHLAQEVLARLGSGTNLAADDDKSFDKLRSAYEVLKDNPKK